MPWFKGQAGWYAARESTRPTMLREASQEIDDMFHNSPLQTKTESEKAFQLGFVASLGNVKAFILGICGAVVFAIMLVSANTMAMSVRQPDPRSGRAENSGIHAPARALDLRQRIRGSRCRRRSLLGILVAIPVIAANDAQFHRRWEFRST